MYIIQKASTPNVQKIVQTHPNDTLSTAVIVEARRRKMQNNKRVSKYKRVKNSNKPRSKKKRRRRNDNRTVSRLQLQFVDTLLENQLKLECRSVPFSFDGTPT